MALTCQKHLFSLDAGIHYINGAYMSPLLKTAEAAGIEAMRLKRSPNRIAPADFFSDTEHLRNLFSHLIGAARPGEGCLIPSASYGMAIVAQNAQVQKGQKIIVTEAQFPSNVYPWMRLAAEQGLELQTIAMPESLENRSKEWSQQIIEAIDSRTAIVALDHVHWACGSVFDLDGIGKKARLCGSLFVVDGTQSVGAMPIDVKSLAIDALVCGGYKWLLGPYGIGYAWLGQAFTDGKPLEENWINRLNSEDFSRLVDYQPAYQPGLRRYDYGEHSNFILNAMAIKALEQLQTWTPAAVQEYCRRLTAPYLEHWQSMGFALESPEDRAAQLIGMQMPEGLTPDRLRAYLQENRVLVSVRGQFVRVSPNVYNDVADMEAFNDALLAGVRH